MSKRSAPMLTGGKASAPAVSGSKMMAPGATTGGYSPYRGPVPDKSPTPVLQPSSAASGVKSAYTVGFPGLSDDEVAAMLGMEYTGDRDQDQMVQDAVESARNQNAIETGTAPSQAEIDERTAAFEDTMEQLRNDPDMREAWGIDRDTRRFSVSDILRVAASFAIPFASGAIVSALNLSGATANITEAALRAAFSSATGQSPVTAVTTLTSAFGSAGNLAESIGNLADGVSIADQTTTVLDTVQDIYRAVQIYNQAEGVIENIQEVADAITREGSEDKSDEEIIEEITSEETPQPDQEPAGEVELPAQTTIEEAEEEPVVVETVVEEAEEEPSFEDQVRAAAEAGIEGTISEPKDTVDFDLFADTTTDDTTVDEGAADGTITEDLSDPLTQDEVFDGELDGGSFFLDVLQQADFNAGNDVVLADGTVINNRTHEMVGTPGYGGAILVTERPTPDESGGGGVGGGGGAADTTAPTTTETTTTDTGEGDTIYADEPSTGLEVGDGTDELIDQLEEAIEAETDDATREDLEEVLEDLKETQAEEPEEAVEQPEPDVFDPAETTAETTETEEAGADEDDEDGLLFIPSFPEEEEEVETPDDVVTTEVETTAPDVVDTIDLETQVPTDTIDPTDSTVDTDEAGELPGDGVTGEATEGEGVDEGVGEGEAGEGEAGTGEAGAGETGTGEEGIGDDGTGEGEGGDGTGEGEGDEDAVAKPRGMMAASRFQPYAGGGLPFQDIPFVGVPYEQKDYMVELNSLINRSLFGDAIS